MRSNVRVRAIARSGVRLPNFVANRPEAVPMTCDRVEIRRFGLHDCPVTGEIVARDEINRYIGAL